MTTSGTYSSSPINTSGIIEHAIRRCKVNPNSLTPETLRIARESLQGILYSLASEGINLWAVQRVFLGLIDGQVTYQLPVGTLDLLTLTYAIVFQSTGTDVAGSQSLTTTLDSSTRIARIGVQFDSIPDNESIVIEFSEDGVSGWTQVASDTQSVWDTRAPYWYEPQVTPTGMGFRVRSLTNPITVNQLILANSTTDVFLSPYNRDDYMNLPNKRTAGSRPTNYLLEKLINPQVTLWPSPSNNTDHMYGMVHRQVQQVGTLTQELQIPARWQEAIIWNLAEVLAWEILDVDPQLIGALSSKAKEVFAQAQKDETDGAPIRIMPNMGRYTR